MGYRYETHAHTKEASACASALGREMADAYRKLGYAGIFITDHFFNGNTAVPEDLPWRERVALYCSGYEHAKEEGDRIGLQVFFGMEYAVGTADFLVYNLNREWLMEHKDIDRMRPEDAFDLMHKDGAFIVQAHPFRKRDYISSVHLFPWHTDAVEILNGAHEGKGRCDEFAKMYADMYGLAYTAGADSHHLSRIYPCGVEAESPLKEAADYGRLILSGKGKLLCGKPVDIVLG